ncbi:class I SAM-dependent methyltransferase [Saccharothrix obliqua]|uniref:class I SAM-dependent methyltransferase n=1 Tax=Saccharothrix obliqua TaxID=2861747 RepID=UPI001C5FF8DC|nr:methyltransferase domain-containing protein [Saccharothrix obliqua]MBW4722041.1 methyltransferase domain-containing protein [Saccharothrix obliqua]
MIDADTARDQQRREWALSAPGWLVFRDNLAARSGTMTTRILAAAAPRRGDRVLDLACGVGNPTGALVAAVRPGGSVLGLDLSPEMIAGAREWAAAAGVADAEFRVVPDERRLGLSPGEFDVAVCRVGLQYMPEPAAALRAVREGLKPGGRMVATTLGDPGRCTAFRISSRVIADHVPPDGPGPVALSDPARLRELFAEAGFADVVVERFETPLIEIDGAEACWDMFERTMGPLIALLAAMPPDRARALRVDGVAALRAEFGDGPVVLTGEALLASGVKR